MAIDGNYPPLAEIVAAPLSGDYPLLVSFNGSGSSDNDGTIVDYFWEFGDGSTGSGVEVSHTYTKPGTFVAKLTVTDNKGASGHTSVGIVATDPYTLNPPSNLTASASGKTVTLKWRDNSSNEDGFFVDRTVKVKKTTTVTRVGNLGPNVVSFSETVPASGSYAYKVSAYRNSPATVASSNEVSIRVK